MNSNKQKQSGIINVGLIVAIIIAAAAITYSVWHVWSGNQSGQTSDSSEDSSDLPNDATKNWAMVTTQGGGLDISIPDGWTITSYPGDYLGSNNTEYKPGVPAIVETSNNDYVGHTLKFRATILPIDDAGTGPQWSSPQPGLDESVDDVAVDNLNGKRYKGVFTQDANQTIYEYVFDLGDGKKLDIVYAVNSDETNEIDIVDKAIKTININL